ARLCQSRERVPRIHPRGAERAAQPGGCLGHCSCLSCGDRRADRRRVESGGSRKQQDRSTRAVTVETSFLPPWWMRNPHVQSLLMSVPFRQRSVARRAAALLATSEEHLLDCGDGVRLQCFVSSPAKIGRPSIGKVAVTLHGWEGNSDALYILSPAQKLFD